ncbi:MAG: chloride channel protein [Vulcanimicrobiaceae bacterium]
MTGKISAASGALTNDGWAGSPIQPNLLRSIAPLSSARFWVALIGTGIGAGLSGAALMTLLRAVQHIAWDYRAGEFLDAVNVVSSAHRVVVVLLAGVLSAAGVLLVRRFLPRGRTLEEAVWFHSGRMPLVTTFANAALSIVIVALGASLGREGAPKEAAAAIGSALSRRLGLAPGQSRILIACGAGAGLAAVYNVPLGGALFAAEVLLGGLALPLVIPALVAAFIATAVSWIALPDRATYTMPAYTSSTSLIVWALLLGPIAGILCVGYVRAIAWAQARGRAQRGWPTLAISIVTYAVLGLTAIAFPQLLGNGKDVVQLALTGSIAVSIVGALLLLKFLATAACLGSGSPGGLFTPTMTLGALLGTTLGQAWNLVWPASPIGGYALVGTGAVLAASTLGPISSIVVLMELTYHSEGLMVPMLLAIAGATFVSRLLSSRSIYSADLERGRKAYHTEPPASSTAFDRMISHDYHVLSASDSYAHVVPKLMQEYPNAVYVVDEAGQLVGSIEGGALDGEEPIAQELTTAGDLARPTPCVEMQMSLEQVLDAFPTGTERLPVVDRATGYIIGVAERTSTLRYSR